MRTLTVIQRKWGGLWRKRHHTAIPDSYDQLTPEQFTAVVLLCKRWITEQQFFARFFGIPEEQVMRLDTFQVYKLNQLLPFLLTPTPVNRMLIPSIRARTREGGISLTPPGAKLAGMTFQQFMTVDTFHSWYIYSEKDAYLHNFIASLYTDPARPFRETSIEESKAAILAEAGNTRDLFEAISVNWLLVRKWLSDAYPKLFPQPPTTAGDGSPAKKKARPSSWLPLFDALVDEDLTRMETYQTLMAIDVIRIINRKLENQKKR